jgi:hypothetical protein
MERSDTNDERDPEVVRTFNPGWPAVQLVYLAFGVMSTL